MSEQPKATWRRGELEVPCLISAEEIARRVEELAEQISADYAGSELLVVGVLKGAWVLMADLVRLLQIPVCCDFLRLASYGNQSESSGRPELLLDLSEPIEGRDVLVVEDLLDTGLSTQWLRTHLGQRMPKSLRFCVLLDKSARRRVDVKAEYVGFEIPDRFVVGYGIDYQQRYRQLPYIGFIETQEENTHEPTQ